MKRTKIKIPIYDCSILILEIESKQDKDVVAKELNRIKANKDEIGSICEEIERECTGGGYTFRNFDLQKIVVLLYPCKNAKERRNLIAHEKRHIEDRLLENRGVNDIEASAYLAGYLGEYMY